jgi:pyocin large subunit-like protein
VALVLLIGGEQVALTSGFDPLLLPDHFARHGAGVGAASAVEYEEKADSFLGGPLDAHSLVGQDTQGDMVRYNSATREFGVMSRDGVIRTYYRIPAGKDGMKYYIERLKR